MKKNRIKFCWLHVEDVVDIEKYRKVRSERIKKDGNVQGIKRKPLKIRSTTGNKDYS